MNRIALLGGSVTALAFFFLPIVNLKPNRLATGTGFGILDFTYDDRFLILFLLSLVPIVLAFRDEVRSRGWTLSVVGGVTLLLTWILPAEAGATILAAPEAYLDGSAFLRNPRILPSGAFALATFGSYVVIFAGLRDLRSAGTEGWVRAMAGWTAPAIAVLLLLDGRFDVYSILVEFRANGAALEQKFVEHLTFVALSLAVGFVVGVGLGLWASRDARVAPVVLYAVGIIQTVPSLALFGVLLVPLARLGDRAFMPTLGFFVAALAVAAALVAAYRMSVDRLPGRARGALLIVTATASTVPLALFVGVSVSFLFRLANVGFSSDAYAGTVSTLGWVLAATAVVAVASRVVAREDSPVRAWLARGAWAGVVASFATMTVLFVQASTSSQVLGRVDGVGDLTIRDLGVSGIGVAPALIALTLYSLLPLVRNTYAGLNAVDPAIIDSGRGMGMTPSQRFFQIELPLAFPVIMAGVRNAGVALVGIGTVATVIGAGGLGDFVIQGIVNTSVDQILLGALPAIVMALVLDAGLRGVERLFTSPGLRQARSG